MDKLIEALKALAEGKGDKAEVAKLFKEHAGAVHQLVFQSGHDVGYGKKAGELTTAQEQVTTLTSENTQLKTDLQKARDQNPDLAKVHTEYQGQIAELKKKHEADLAAVNGKLAAKDLSLGKGELVKALVDQGVDPDYASTVLANREDVVSRIKPEPSGIQFMQAGGTIPFAAAGEKSPAALFAEELVKTVQPKWIVAKGGPGAGPADQSGNVPPAAATLIKEIREQAKAEKDARTGQAQAAPDAGIAHLAATGQ